MEFCVVFRVVVIVMLQLQRGGDHLDLLGNHLCAAVEAGEAAADAAGATQRDYIWLGDLPVMVVDNVAGAPVMYAVHTDHLGRPVVITKPDSSWAWSAAYKPFGETLALYATNTTMDIRFPGQWFQLESGLAYNWHRHYDATTGRYLQPDPLGFVDGPGVYGYAGGNPLGRVDSEGLETRAVQRFQLNLMANTNSRPPKAAA